jgi:hypothetical protein
VARTGRSHCSCWEALSVRWEANRRHSLAADPSFVDCVAPNAVATDPLVAQHWPEYHYCFDSLDDVVAVAMSGIVPLVAPGHESYGTTRPYSLNYNWRTNWCPHSAGSDESDVCQTSISKEI